MPQRSIPKDPEAWIELYKTLGNNNTRAFAPTQEGEKSKHGSASQATLTTLLHYRILWKKEYSCDPKEIWFSHYIFRGNSHLKNRISQKVNTLATSEANSARCFRDLLRKIAESKGNFPTPADETEILNSSSMQTFGNFVHCLRQINCEPSTQQYTPSLDLPQENRIYVHSVDSESLLVTPVPRDVTQLEQRHKQNQNFNAEMSKTTRNENIKRHLSPLPPKGYHMAGDNDDGDNGDGDSDDGDSDGVGDVTFQESSSPDFIPKGSVDSSKEVDSPMPLPPGGNTVPVPQPRAASSEQTVVLTCINLLITICQQVGNRALFVTAENRIFSFHDHKGAKIWEGRCDGLVFMSSPEKKEAIFGIIEAKRGLRTDDVRYQEGAEMVALIRDQERRGVRCDFLVHTVA